MQPKTLLALTVAVLVLGAFIFFYEKDLPSTDERVELAKKVLRLESDAVEALLIEWGDRSVRLERQRSKATDEGDQGEDSPSSGPNDSWRIVSPLDARADRAGVDGLVDSLADLEFNRSIEDFDRGELGLDDPRARVTITTDSGQSVLEIGAELPASSDMVVAVGDGATAYTVASTLFDDLTQEPGDWRDKKLFDGLRGDIERISLIPSSTSEQVLLAKRGDNFWIESPLTDRSDEDLTNTLLSELTGLRAEAFVDEPLLTPEGMGLEPPRGVLEVVLTGRESPFRLELGSEAGGDGVVYGRAGSQLFEAKTRLTESLATSAADWRSKSWTSLQVFKIETARFETSEGPLEISRDGADWKRGEDRVSYTVASDLLYPITEAKGEQVLDRAAAIASGHDLETASLTITLSTQEGDEEPESEELRLFHPVEGFAAATSGDRDAVLLLSEDSATEILDKLTALGQAEPLPNEDEESGETAEGS